MASNYLSTLRKSYFIKVLFSSVLSNLVLFGAPLQEMVTYYVMQNDQRNIYAEAPGPATQITEPDFVMDSAAPLSVNSLPEKEVFFPNNSSTIYYAEEKHGIVGVDPGSTIENPYDNFFTVNLPDDFHINDYDVVLSYDLYGLASAEQTTKRINNKPAYGGKLIQLSKEWTSVSEIMPKGYMKSGLNEIFFNRRIKENYQYEIKNLKIELRGSNNNDVKLAGTTVSNNNGVMYFIASVANPEIVELEILGEVIPVFSGVAEKVFTAVPKGLKRLEVSYKTQHGEKKSSFPVKYYAEDPQFNFNSSALEANTSKFDIAGSLRAEYDSLSISIQYENISKNSQIAVSGLQFKDLKATNADVEIVTAGKFKGYRIQKINIPDSIGTVLHLKYDPDKIPTGYTAKDVRTYFYDAVQRVWTELPIDSLNIRNNELIVTAYSNDTDYINGVIKLPGSPETSSFAPTAMSDIKFADPGAGVVSISPPTPSSTGAAATGFPLKVPAGRNGMQPSLQVSYNSEAGNGWMGIGWNLSIPAITLNTKWGVPRFDSNLESELYSLNGEDLVLKLDNGEYTTPNRTPNILQGPPDRQFYQRKEGSYNQIIRKGDSPDNYYWIVTDKMGNKSYYGKYSAPDNDNGVIRTGNTSGNIAHWALKRTEDTYGNYVDYTYTKGTETINGVDAQWFYVSQIDYTLKGTTNTNFYRIKFIRNNTRIDKTTNARSGYVQITNNLLIEVQEYYVNNGQESLIRKYGFNYYGESDPAFSNPFKKSVLKSIAEYDTAGNLFYNHSMEYYNEVGSGAIINGQATRWNGDVDTVSPLGVLTGIALGTQGSALGTSTSVGGTGGVRGGAGIGLNFLSTGATLGASGNFSHNESNTQISFMDINGDGRPDKLFKDGSSIMYRANLGLVNGTGQFGDPITIMGLSKLGKTTSNTVGYGADLNLMFVGVGASGSDTWAQSDNYFTDFNGDGLPDMVTDGQIKFNANAGINPNDRSFTTNVTQTENEITAGTMLGSVLSSMALPTLEALQKSYPQFDHVKVWEAPYTGLVQISGASLVSTTTCGSPNIFKYTIEWKHLVNGVWVTTVLNSPTQSGSSITIPTVSQLVSKGDQLFFRIHNNEYGCGGKIRWNPVITYQQSQTPLYYNGSDENGKNFMSFDYAADYIVNNGGTTDIGGTAVTLNVDFNLSVAALNAIKLSDNVRFTIQRIRYNIEDSNIAPSITTYTRTFSPASGGGLSGGSSTISIVMNAGLQANQRDVLYCFVDSESNVDWSAIKWKPKYTVGSSSTVEYPGVTYIPYSDNVAQKRYWILPAALPNVTINPNIPGDAAAPLLVISHDLHQINWQAYLDFSNPGDPTGTVRRKVSWVVKKRNHSTGNGTILHTKTFYLNRSGGNYSISRNPDGSQVLQTTDIDYALFFGVTLSKQEVKTIKDQTEVIYSAFYIENALLVGPNTNYNPAAITLALHPTVSGSSYPGFAISVLPSPFLSKNGQVYGYGYRGWGTFLYNGGFSSDGTINYGIDVIPASLFDGQELSGTAEVAAQAGTNTTPDDVLAMNSGGMNMRYVLYKPSNGANLYASSIVKYKTTQGDEDATFGPNGSNVLYATLGRFGIGDLHSQYVDVNNLAGSPGTFVGLKQYSESHGSAVSITAGLPEFSGAGTSSQARSTLNNQYMDFNGDRYPDLVTQGAIQFTGMLGGLTQVTQTNGIHTSGSRSEDQTAGFTVSGLHPNSTASDKGVPIYNGTKTQANSGINATSGITKNANQWVDINGDGLPDKVNVDTDGNRVTVYLNTGYGFSGVAFDWIVNSGGLNLGSNSGGSASLAGGTVFPQTSFAAGLGVAQNSAHTETLFLDVNGDGLPDLVKRGVSSYSYYLNTGTAFSTTSSTFYAGSDADQEKSLSGNAFGSFTWGFPIIPFPVPIKTSITPTLSLTAGFNEKQHSFDDIDGDGFVDVLHQVGSSNGSIDANLNKMGKTYLLKRVHTALGGSWVIDYTKSGNTYDMPQSKWVLSSIETDDGFITDTSNNFGPSKTKAAITYANPKHDRREREFFGYGTVTVEERDPANNNTYRFVITSYHNENYYLSGAQKSRIMYDNTLQVLSEESTLYNLLHPDTPQVNPNATAANNYMQASIVPTLSNSLDRTRLFIAIAKVSSTTYEGSQSLTTLKHFLSYDGYGNLKEYKDDGEGPDDAYKTVIEYHPYNLYMAYGPGFPKKISVYNGTGTVLLRERSATYNAVTGGLYEISTNLTGGTTPDYNIVRMEYDIYGNTTKVNDLENKHTVPTNHYFKAITYDSSLKTFPIKIVNSFGDETYFEQYNYLFGVPCLTRDVNNQKMRTRIDNRGRVVEVTGPNEMDVEATNGGNAWTIRMEYENAAMLGSISSGTYMVTASAACKFEAVAPGLALPTTKKHYALTRHFDPEYATGTGMTSTNQMLTVSLVDGFGQAIQMKKAHLSGGAMKWMVSGFEKKDPFGRVLQSYLPIVETGYPANPVVAIAPTSTIYNYNTGTGIQPFTIMTYDSKDRVKTVKQVGLTLLTGETDTATTDYVIEDGMYVQKLTNERGQTLDTYTDIRGRNRKTVQNQEITTTYQYNAINELLKVVDNENFETEYLYDLAGRKIEMRHPDRGVVTFKYDKASRMTEQSNSKLLVTGEKIKYYYDCSRLVRVEYPQNPQNEVKYTYGSINNQVAITERAIGRLLVQEDATGIQLFGYGRMGEMTKNLRSVAVANYQSYWFLTQWKYDSWNRVQEIVYPDQETVFYKYNTAGALQGMDSQMAGIASGAMQPIISSILYNDLGERASITHGSGATATTTNYSYDVRRRMNNLAHTFIGLNISKGYTYDALSNITDINTAQQANFLPATGKIGGPVKHHYDYDTYNRLTHADGTYTGANDSATPSYLRTTYTLDMEYNPDHTIKKKTQSQQVGSVNAYADVNINNLRPVQKTSYVLDYGGYGDGALTTGSYGYQQPHAPRTITEKPSWVANPAADDPRIKNKEILYDATGNQTEIKETLGGVVTSLRKNLWDEENRLKAVNLKPDDPTAHPIAIYTYDAGGERTVRYNYDRIDTYSNAAEVGQLMKDNVMLYPSGLIMGKPAFTQRVGKTLAYTKHYYIGSERVSAKTGTMEKMGDYPEMMVSAKFTTLSTSLQSSLLRLPSTNTQVEARETVRNLHFALLGQYPQPDIPTAQQEPVMNYGPHDENMLNIYHHHPDHLGSSSYITNGAGVVCQHMEYLPFGETLVDEHLNSNNSPFKFNGKEFDEETGNYYYSARYYDPKLSIFISVDPLAEKTRDAYGYCYQNPINLIDPSGMEAVTAPPTDYVNENGQLLLRTDDGSNAVITVPKDKEKTFTSSVLSSTSGLNSKSWNFTMKAYLVGKWNQQMENIQSWYATPNARKNAVRFWQTGDYDYWHEAAMEHTSTFRKDILGWGLSIGGAIYGSALLKTSRVLKYDARVRMRGLEDPVSHNFPYSFDETILSTKPTVYQNGYKIYRQPGTMGINEVRPDGTIKNGIKSGVFEIGVDKNGIIDHRFFRPNK